MVQPLPESSTRAPLVPGVVSAGALLAAAAVFLFCCFAAAADAQGATLFFLGAPVMLGLLVIALLLADSAKARGAAAGPALKWLSVAGLVFVAAFFVCAFVPQLKVFPGAVIGAVAKTYEAATGESPYAAAHRGRP
ncbi:MAG TPA: hypothetical protein VFV71_00700 [Burkholderiales bacterium]|nr:hypothetical protein [Burkholderiales bacterium]